tara:strand:- start:120 stop:785 length:666 start_codon:yes stop_codon:yes gene_type:complete
MKVLELFSGTHSIGKVCKDKGWEVVSLDLELGGKCPFPNCVCGYESDIHIEGDIMTWDYKKEFNVGDFDLITASPVCTWWSLLRTSWIGRKLKCHNGEITTPELLQEDIEKFGVPMVDKVFEIIEYFKPTNYWIENPQTGQMKNYINELIPYYDVDYCMYCDWGYKKRTRFWTDIEGFIPKKCSHKTHDKTIGSGTQTTTLYDRYRIPPKVIEELLDKIQN